MRYARPATLEEALGLLADDQWRILAGGTDFYPAQGARPIRENVLDINGIGALRSIRRTASHLVIGARATWSDVVRADLPPAFHALRQAGREVGAIQIQNRGTIAGNLCNASPAADGVPALLVLDAEVELASLAGTRVVPLERFLLGNRSTVLEAGEIVVGVRVPLTSTDGTSSFLKLGARRYLVISIAMAAVRLKIDDGLVRSAAIAVGACSPVARRLPELEKFLLGAPADRLAGVELDDDHFRNLSPIDDVRASATYRGRAVRELVRRSLVAAVDPAGTAERAA